MIQGRIAEACDVVTQRLKGLEQVSGGGHYQVAQRQELVPLEVAVIATPMETLEAGRLHREELRARSAASRPWERRGDWERKTDETKGKGKGKDTKGKGKYKGDRQGHAKDDKEKERK